MTLVEAFEGLEPHERAAELQNLVNSLSISDARKLCETIQRSKNSFKCDVFGRLPSELSCLITQYLPLQQCFEACRVSRTWKAKLSNTSLLRQRLGSWQSAYAETDGDLASIAQNVVAYTRFSPFPCKYADRDVGFGHMSEIAYTAGCLAWLSQDTRSVEILDLQVDRSLRFNMINREQILAIALTPDTLVTLSMSAKCVIWDLRNPKVESVHRLQLESTKFDSIYALKDAVVQVV